MSTSGTVAFTMTLNEIVETAFGHLGIAQEGEAVSARMYADGKRALNLMVKTWGAQPHLWTLSEGTLALVASQATYVLTPKPMRVLSVRRRQGGIDTPLNEMSRQEYFDQPSKTGSTSTPVSFYYDPQRDTGTLYLWPAPSAQVASLFSVNFTWLRRMDDMTSASNEVDLPQEWLEAVTWNLAKRLMTQYPVNDQSIAAIVLTMASELFGALKGWDQEPADVQLQPAWNDWGWRY